MPLFKYSGYRTDGATVDGLIEASGYSEALSKIKATGVCVRDLSESNPAKTKTFRLNKEQFLLSFTRNLSVLLDSGVPLLEALNSLSVEASNRHRELIIAIKDRVASGMAFHKALEDFKEVFPEFYIGMIQAGEWSASLNRVLSRLTQFLESQTSIKAKVKNALIYPLFMLFVSSAVLTFIFIFVIPKITRIFKDTNAPLPFITKLLINTSTFIVDYWWVLFALLIGIVYTLERLLAKRKRLVDSLLMRLPGSIVQSLYYSRFARTLAFLVEGGVPVLSSLRLASRATGNSVIEAMVSEAEDSINKGSSLASSLKGFPAMFIQLVSTGEKTGRLFETLNKSADLYEEEFNKKVARLMSLFEPALIVTMGVIVCMIVLAVLLPLFQMNQLIR